MTDAGGDSVGDIALRYIAYLAGERETAPGLDGLDEAERPRAAEVCAALAAAWRAAELDPPPLEQDPLAVSLGLVADPSRPLDGSALASLRKRTGLRVSELAERLQGRGWTCRTADVFSWEGQASAAVPPAIITALAEELDVAIEQLVGQQTRPSAAIAAATSTERFHVAARRWASLLGLGGEEKGATALQQLMLAGVARRGEELTAEAWLDAIDALIDARESRKGPK